MRFVSFFLLLSFPLLAKIRLLTFHFNSPELISLQKKAFDHYLSEEYELIIFNDANTEENEGAIRKICDQFHLPCIRYEQHWHDTAPLTVQLQEWMRKMPEIRDFLGRFADEPSQHPSVRHSHVIQYALDHFGYEHDDLVAIIDGDLFPVRPVCLRELSQEGDIVGIGGYRAPFILFHPRTLPDIKEMQFTVTVVYGETRAFLHDTGSACQYYLQNHPHLTFVAYPQYGTQGLHRLSAEELTELGFTEKEIRFIRAIPDRFDLEFHIDKRFIHLGSSTSNLMATKIKLKCMQTYLDVWKTK